MPADEVVVTTLVSVSVADAFEAFTDDIDRWWRRPVTDSVMRFEGDRLMMATANAAEVVASVSAWEPPHRIELQWSGPHSVLGDVVSIEFRPEGEGTRVTIRHRRAGLRPEEAAAAVIGLWWGGLLQRLLR